MNQEEENASANSSTSAPPAEGVSVVALKLPPYWPADPELWFLQVEAQFATRKITADRTKYHHIVASLPPDIATEVRDLLLQQPATDAYATLKRQLIRRTTASEERRLQQLLTTEELGDRRPTQLLRRMQQLMGEKASTIDASFLRNLFVQRLPHNVRMILASVGDLEIERLAELADKLMEISTPVVSAVQTPADEIQQLRAEISRLTIAVATLQQHRGRSQSRSQRRRPSPSPARTDICWYHRRFGDNATKCTTPCHYTGNGTAEH